MRIPRGDLEEASQKIDLQKKAYSAFAAEKLIQKLSFLHAEITISIADSLLELNNLLVKTAVQPLSLAAMHG